MVKDPSLVKKEQESLSFEQSDSPVIAVVCPIFPVNLVSSPKKRLISLKV